MIRSLHSHFAFLLLLSLCATVRAAEPKNLVKPELLADTSAVKSGEPFRIGLRLKIEPKWHIYWSNPGEGGIPTTIDMNLPEGFDISEWQYPEPSTFPLQEGQTAFGYENEVLLIATVTPPKSLASNEVKLSGKASWMACQTVCTLGDADVTLVLPVGEVTPANREQFENWQKRVPIAAEKAKAIKSIKQSAGIDRWSATVEWTDPAVQDVAFFPPANDALTFEQVKIEKVGGQTKITAKLTVLAGWRVSPDLGNAVIGFRTAEGVRQAVTVPLRWQPSLGP